MHKFAILTEAGMKKILIVEDDLDIQDIFRIIFSTYGYAVECMDNGRHLYEKEHDWPDAIILDKQLPGMDGIQVCKHLKSRNSTKNIPVIMISATAGVESAAKLAGADDFIEKPFNMHNILKKVAALVDNQNSATSFNISTAVFSGRCL
jgi:DNA-binding response OmpR family regulator